MRLRELGEWVGLNGKAISRRAKSLGYEILLDQKIDVGTANKLYRELPTERTMTISYDDTKRPTINMVGPWNINDWNRLFKKIQHAIMIRNRDFIRAARKGLPEEETIEPFEAPPEEQEQTKAKENQEDQSTVEMVANIDSLKDTVLEENDYAGRTDLYPEPDEPSRRTGEPISATGQSPAATADTPAD